MILYAVVFLTSLSCSRLKMSNREEKVLSIEEKREIEAIEEEIIGKEVEEIDLSTRTMGYTLFHVVFMSKMGGYLLFKKILSSSKLTKEVRKRKKAKMMKKHKKVSVEEEILLTPMAIELLNRQDERGRTPLKVGVESRSIEIIRACAEDESLREVIDWDREDSEGVSPILEATLREDIEMCEILEMAGAEPQYKKRVLKAVEAGKRAVLEKLLKRVDIRDMGKKAVGIAIERQDVDILHLLLQAGAKVSKRVQKIGMMLFKERDKDIYEDLLEMTEIKSGEILSVLIGGIDEKEKGRTSLMYAIEGECSLDILKKIVTRMSIEEVLKEDIKGRNIKEYKSIHEKYVEKLYDIYKKAREEVLLKILALSYGGNIELVEELIDSGANLEAVDEEGDRALIYAAKNGHIEVVLKLIDSGANIEVRDREGYTILMCAAESGHIEMVSKLLDLGVNIEVGNKEGYTPLMCAALNGHIEVVLKLIDSGASIEARDREGYTALMCAAESGHIEVAKKLIELGANIEARDREGYTILMCAAENGHIEVAKKLIELGANIEDVDEEGYTALMWAVHSMNRKIVLKLMELGANIDATDKNGNRALIIAAKKGSVEIVSILLTGIDARLVSAYEEGDVEKIADVLINKWKQVDVFNKNGETALMVAVSRGHVEVVSKLLELGANRKLADKNGNTALALAANIGSVEIISILLKDVETGLMFTNKDEELEEVVNLLVSECRYIDAVNKEEKTALMIAAERGYLEVVLKLIELGASTRFTNKKGETALLLAIKGGEKCREVVRILKSMEC